MLQKCFIYTQLLIYLLFLLSLFSFNSLVTLGLTILGDHTFHGMVIQKHHLMHWSKIHNCRPYIDKRQRHLQPGQKVGRNIVRQLHNYPCLCIEDFTLRLIINRKLLICIFIASHFYLNLTLLSLCQLFIF